MILVRALAMAASAHVAFSRVSHKAMSIVGDAAIQAFHEHELDALGALIYDAGSLHRSDRVEEWEAQWWSSALPRVPGRILVAACGAGREVAWLQARGWHVDAFDPARSLVDLARRRAMPGTRIDVLDFHGFVRAVADEGEARSFDAVLIGWGGLSHALSHTSRATFLRACATVCPDGPILASWQPAPPTAQNAPRANVDQRARLGVRVGASLAALRGVDASDRSGVRFLAHAGATAFLELAAAERIARDIGRTLRHDGDAPLPHGAFVVARKRPSAPDRKRTKARADRVVVQNVDDVAIDLLADVLAARGRHRFVARGGSMHPAIRNGAALTLETATDVRTGDVVAARIGRSLFVHRVVGRDAHGHLLLKGDACPSPDGWITQSMVIGVVAAVDDGPVLPRTTPAPRWRRGLARIGRAARVLRSGSF